MCKKTTAFVLIFVFCLCLVIWLCIFEKNQKNNILEGIYIDKIYVGGLNKEEARNKIQDYFRKNKNKKLVLLYSKHKWCLDYLEILDLDINEAVDKALSFGRKGLMLNTFFTRIKLKYSPEVIPILCNINEQNFRKLLRDIRGKTDKNPKDAFFYLDNNEINIAKEVKGAAVDDIKLRNIIKSSFIKNKTEIKIPIKILDANVNANSLRKLEIKHKLMEFSTFFNNTNKNRTENLKLAASKINGYILKPGEIFSFNKVVGKRSKENGYKKAPVIIKGKTMYDVGGGVCQVSSTIYNAVLLLDLEIVERKNHSRPVDYVPLGQDATVEFDLIDFKFRNNTDGNLVLFTMIEKNRLNVMIYSNKKANKNISLFSEIIETIPPSVKIEKDSSLRKGKIRIKKGKQGYKVKVWKSSDGDNKKVISIDTYSPIDTIIYVGKKE